MRERMKEARETCMSLTRARMNACKGLRSNLHLVMYSFKKLFKGEKYAQVGRATGERAPEEKEQVVGVVGVRGGIITPLKEVGVVKFAKW